MVKHRKSSNDSVRQTAAVGGVWEVLSRIVPLAGTAILSVVMAHVLGAAALGQQSLVVYVEAVLSAIVVQSFTDAGMRSLAAALGANDQSRAERLVAWIMLGHLLTGMLVAVALVVVGVVRTDERGLWFIIAICTVANAIGWAYATRIVAAHGYRLVSLFRLFGQCGSQILGILAVILGYGIAGVLWANLPSAVAIAAAFSRRRLEPGGTWGPMPVDLLRLWVWFIPSVIIYQVVVQRIEFVFLGIFGTFDEIAMYSIAFMVVSVAVSVPTAFFTASWPSIARSAGAGDLKRLTQHLSRACRIVLAISLAIFGLLVALAPAFVTGVYGREFKPAVQIIPIMAVVALVAPLGFLCNSYWSGLGQLRGALRCGVMGAALDITLALALIPRWGILGAALANVGGQCLTAFALFHYTWVRAGRFRVGITRLATTTVVCLIAIVAASTTLSVLPGWPGFCIAGAVCLLVFALGGLMVGYLSESDADWLLASFPHQLLIARPLLCGRLDKMAHLLRETEE